ncbi:PilZ domain-containing protein [Salidesulfovibrio brasiliensis]|uniref:PilZ domain-containing protein n=1 Tax=Salidesulfovibrio brasiliensis TaxID=221711 RepID=UPI0006D037A4|nr:PilZ domain-containing protein [Salidesulfovibrio brasiliensis]
MLDVSVQLDYLRQIQRSFAHGSQRFDLIEVFGTMLLYVMPVVGLFAAWRYRSYLQYLFIRFISVFFRSKSHGDIEDYLTNKAVMLEVHFLDGEGIGRLLCHARISSVFSGRMSLDLVRVEPSARKLKGQQVLCLCKPFVYSGRKINSFVSYISFAKKRGAMVKKLVLLTPLKYRFTIRRKHARQKVTRQEMFRIKAWDGRRRNTFWQHRPDMQTISRSNRTPDKMHLRVGNISPGGIRLFIENPKPPGLPPLTQGQTLVLRISIKQPGSKKFMYFTVLGTIRSRFKEKNGAVGLGIQFTALAEKHPGEGTGYTWRSVKDEVLPLKQFLDRLGSKR